MRKKSGRKPLDPNLPRDIVPHELPESAADHHLQHDHLLGANLVHADEAVIQMLKEPGRAAQTKSDCWAQTNGTGPPICTPQPSRGRFHANPLYVGIRRREALMSGGYEVYAGLAEAHGLTSGAGHARGGTSSRPRR